MRAISLIVLAVLTAGDRPAGRPEAFDIGRGERLGVFVPSGMRSDHEKGDDVLFLSTGETVGFTIVVFSRETPEASAHRHWDWMHVGDTAMTPIQEKKLGNVTALVFSTTARGLTFVYSFRSFPGGPPNRAISVAGSWPTSRDREMFPVFEEILSKMAAWRTPTRK